MLYIILAILITVTNVIMYRVGKRTEKQRIMTRFANALDVKLIEEKHYGKAFAKLLNEMRLEMHNIPPLKIDPTPINRDIMKEVDNEYCKFDRKTNQGCRDSHDTRCRTDGNRQVHVGSQSDEQGRS